MKCWVGVLSCVPLPTVPPPGDSYPIFSPLSEAATSQSSQVLSPDNAPNTLTSLSGHAHSKALDTTPTLGKGTGNKDNLATPLAAPRWSVATPPTSTSTPAAGRSVRVVISARKLREIESPYSSDQSSAASLSGGRGQGQMQVARGASPGNPAPPPQPGEPPQHPAPPHLSRATHEVLSSAPPPKPAAGTAPCRHSGLVSGSLAGQGSGQ